MWFVQTEIFELAALAIFKDLHEGMSEEEQEEELLLEEGQLTAQLHHYLPNHWFKALETKRIAVQKQQLSDWDAMIVYRCTLFAIFVVVSNLKRVSSCIVSTS